MKTSGKSADSRDPRMLKGILAEITFVTGLGAACAILMLLASFVAK